MSGSARPRWFQSASTAEGNSTAKSAIPSPLLLLRDVDLTFSATPLLSGAGLTVAAGDRICLVGRNGSGTSTLLRRAAKRAAPRLKVRLEVTQPRQAADRELGDCHRTDLSAPPEPTKSGWHTVDDESHRRLFHLTITCPQSTPDRGFSEVGPRNYRWPTLTGQNFNATAGVVPYRTEPLPLDFFRRRLRESASYLCAQSLKPAGAVSESEHFVLSSLPARTTSALKPSDPLFVLANL
jgi:energy-coupling factor transporter ATP-binding protein EcfA2